MLLPHVDVGSEAAAWNHAHVHTTPLAFAYGDDTVATYRAAFANLDDRALQQQVAALILAHHAHLSPAIAIEELCNLEAAGLAMHPEEVERVLAGLVRSVRQGAGNWMEVIRAWTERAARRLPQGAWQNDRLAALWTAAHLPQHQAQGQLTIPEGLDVNRVRWLFTQAPTPRHYALHQREGMLYAEPETPPEEAVLAAPGSLLGRLRTALVNVQVRYAGTGGGDAAVALQTLERGIALPEEGTLVLRTEHQEVRIESLTRPAWAEGIGCDPQGLFVTWAEDTRKAYWLPPGSYPVTDREAVPLGHRVLEKGFWCDAEEALALLQDGFRQSSWATGYGLDDYGLYAEFRLGEVTQRLRWIPPGEFRMGSPESEPERFDSETRHGVLLTQGFWLADTACTQALWPAVMGDNPSHFKGAERPVEQVSWDDVQVFLQRLNEVAPELGLRLPTEAEWEYACRAGTETPFWFGAQITPEQVNYAGNYPYAGGKRGLNRGETVSVKALPCNGWGLYQMHGNVWEWCQDWYAAYADTSAELPAVDPGGPAPGDARVLRGGCWFLSGRHARSAQRGAGGPGGRYGCPGFRLARGQARIEAPEAPGKHRVHRAGQT
jgi:formylglycine-generating enzyme required for sulfatase activity